VHPGDSPTLRKRRGAFFTPPAIAKFLADWAIAGDPSARVMDPTSGEGVFLLAAAEKLRELGATPGAIGTQVSGVDLHRASLDGARDHLAERGLSATLRESDFFDVPSPDELEGFGWQDAVLGNPPFVRYQKHTGEARAKALRAALAQKVSLSGLASSWAATLVHSSAFLKPDGRLAMVVPAELLTVGYAEPIRRWLRERFAAVNLVMFDRLQFEDATEQVVLLVARGSGGCDAFSLFHVDDAEDLAHLHALDGFGVTPAAEGKWTDLVLPLDVRRLFKRVTSERMTRLDSYGNPELGTVTGANRFFAISEATRHEYGIEERHLKRLSPPGTKHLRGLTFSRSAWEDLKVRGERVWLLHPEPTARSVALKRYVTEGERLKLHENYKCAIRQPWWRPPAVSSPDLFFTYMSHRYPRLVANSAKVTFTNSMHGVRLREGAPEDSALALPLLCLNSATMLGAEVHGRSYGGGILKMEPREAAALPMPTFSDLAAAWTTLRPERARLDQQLREGDWTGVVARVDATLLQGTMNLSSEEAAALKRAADQLRARRMRAKG
jgi:adenine-specific DNA-methyltransferase